MTGSTRWPPLCNPPSETCPTGQLAVTLDGRVITAPTIQVASFERDQITISGSYTEDEARTVAALLDSGSLPGRAAGRRQLAARAETRWAGRPGIATVPAMKR